jgi:hypothetical protein
LSSSEAAGADYVVTLAGTTAARGDYNANGTYNGHTAYEKVGGGAWLYVNTAFLNMVPEPWSIDETKGNESPWYAATEAHGSTPSIGAYTPLAGSAPDASVATG